MTRPGKRALAAFLCLLALTGCGHIGLAITLLAERECLECEQ